MKSIALLAVSTLALISSVLCEKSIDLTNFHDRRYAYPIEVEVGDTF